MNLSLMTAELRIDEGVRYFQYLDSMGFPTIGVGHNLNASPLPAWYVPPLNDDQVNSLLLHDLQIVFAALDLHFPWWRNLDEVRQRVIANMCFNMGIRTLLTFVNTMHDVQIGDYLNAAAAMSVSKWAVQVGNRAARLISAMRSGVMPDENQN